MATLRRVSPILGVRDVPAAVAQYARLGFTARTYEGDIYGFAMRDGIEIHLGSLPAGAQWTRTPARRRR